MQKEVITPKGDKVIIKSRPWHMIWLLPGFTITLSPYVYTPANNFTEERKVNLFYVAVHEAVHLRQQKEVGKWKFYWKYLTNRSFRYQMEFEAYLEEFQQNIAERRKPRLESTAKLLSSFPYFWCVKEEVALSDFKKALNLT